MVNFRIWRLPGGVGRPLLVSFSGNFLSPESLKTELQGSGAATLKEELLGDRVLTWHPKGESGREL